MPADPHDRQAVVTEILADPPAVHPMDRTATPTMGVWSTDEACYRFIAERCPPGTRTLETGSGLSTVLFAALGARHLCCTAGPEEAERVRAHCNERAIPVEGLRFEIGSSHRTLPPLEAEGVELDLVLVDGGHGFPLPVLDWFHAASLLREGGTLIVDDIDLPAVRVLTRYLDRDPRWERLDRTRKWAAWRRASSGPLCEDWTEQPFYAAPRDRATRALRRVTGLGRRALGRAQRLLAARSR